MQLAKRITFDRANSRVLIDGVEFPYYLDENGPTVNDPQNNNALPVVYLPVLAEDIEILPKTPLEVTA